MATYLVKPNDTLFFRGGEPMGMGESHFQTSVFPPSPETFVGAIRTLIISRRGNGDFEGYKNGKYKDKDWYKEIGFNTLPNSFGFVGPFLIKDNKILFVPPSNLFMTSDKKFAVAAPKSFPEAKYLLSLKNIMWIDKHDDIEKTDLKPVDGYMTIEGMGKYLRGSIDELDYKNNFIQSADLFKNEQRTGIALEKGLRIAKERHLYMTSHKRFKEDTGMIFLLSGVTSFPDSDILQLGGENRTVSYEKITDISVPSYEKDIEIFVTAMPLKVRKVIKGIPLTEFLDDDLNVALPGGIRSKLLSYSVNRPLLFGGWDIAENKSKDMVQYLPAGSVFYFEKCNVKENNYKILLGGKNVQ